METICRYCGNTDAPECCSAKVFLARARKAEEEVLELRRLVDQWDDPETGYAVIKKKGVKFAAEDLVRDFGKMKKALKAIVLHGQHPTRDANWAAYALDIANGALQSAEETKE